MTQEEKFLKYLRGNPDITVEAAFFEAFRFFPDATLDELNNLFKKVMLKFMLGG